MESVPPNMTSLGTSTTNTTEMDVRSFFGRPTATTTETKTKTETKTEPFKPFWNGVCVSHDPDTETKTEKEEVSEEEMKECEICHEKWLPEETAGCCNDGDCPHHIETMCAKCGVWSEEEGVWRCDKCAEEDAMTYGER